MNGGGKENKILNFEKGRLTRALNRLRTYQVQLEYLDDQKNEDSFIEAARFFLQEQTALCGRGIAFQQLAKVLGTDDEEVVEWYSKDFRALMEIIPFDERGSALYDLTNYLEIGEIV